MGVDLSRKLRSDAEDNRSRMLSAARELFTERGLDVGMREVARHADVGPATLYRRFPTKQMLVDTAFQVELRACATIVDRGCADPDAWAGFRRVVEELVLLNAGNRGFVEAITATTGHSSMIAEHRHRLLGALARLGERAKEQGELRSDFTIDDLVMALIASRALGTVGAARQPAAARRFAELTLDAFRR